MHKPTKALADKAAAELVEELLDTVRNNTGEPWFLIIHRKITNLLKISRKLK